jgi:hypothetical protein
MSNLYKDAILDAKALRASAIANAKSALEEAFGPKIEAIVRKSLSEEMEEEGMDMEQEGMDKKKMHEEDGEMTSEMEDINEEELDEILNQLEEMSDKKDKKHEGEDMVNEAEEGEEEKEGDEEEKDSEEGAEDSEDAEEGEEAGEEAEEEAGEEAEGEVDDETKIVDITLGDLKQVIQSLMPAGGEEMAAGEELGAEEGGEEAEEEAEVSLDEILDELEAEGAENIGEYDAEDSNDIDTQGTEQGFGGRDGDMKELHFQSFIKTPGQGGKDKEVKEGDKEGARDAFGDAGKVKYNEASKKELKEARATINTLRKELQEVNLLNAKFLYMNKLFKGKSLNETQKMRVVNALDRATTVKEVKLAYETLSESLQSVKPVKRSITEGFASKPAGMAPKANIVEADQFINRWQKLAGIKK